MPSDLVWEIAESYVDDFLVVNDDQATAALTWILERSKLMVEAAGAVGLAAVMEKLIPDDAPDPICVVLSGGNIDLMFLEKAVRHGLEASGRFARFKVLVPDEPGNLARILAVIAENGGQPGPRRASPGGVPAPLRQGGDRALSGDQRRRPRGPDRHRDRVSHRLISAHGGYPPGEASP